MVSKYDVEMPYYLYRNILVSVRIETNPNAYNVDIWTTKYKRYQFSIAPNNPLNVEQLNTCAHCVSKQTHAI
jgi:hypothetical protein